MRGSQQRAAGTRTLLPALILLGVAAVGMAAIESVLLIDVGGPTLVLLLFPATGLIYLAVGVLAWVRRPSHRMGPLLGVGGFVWLAAGLGNTSHGALVAVGQMVATVPLAIVLHLLLAFPSGRVGRGGARVLVVAGYVTTVVLQAPIYLFGPESGEAGPLVIADRPDLAALGHQIQSNIGAVIVIVTSVVLLRRLLQATPARRRVLAPLYGFGSFAIVGVSASVKLLKPYFDLDPLVVVEVQIGVLAGVPIAFVAGMLRGGFARTAELAELGSWLGGPELTRGGLDAALARTLGDPSVSLIYRVESGHGGPDYWVDEEGGRVDPIDAPGAGSAPVVIDGQQIAALRYDVDLTRDHEEVSAVGRVAALAIARQQLTTQLLASQEQLRDSRTRLLHAGDRERRGLAQDLHDRLQSRLVLLGMQVGVLLARPECADRAALTGVRAGLDEAITELRLIVQGVMPALLLERGLYAALAAMADSCPLPTELTVDADPAERLPTAVESTAYHVVAEALANAVKHSGARVISVRVRRPPMALHLEVTDDGAGGAVPGDGLGLSGMADRVAALRGVLTVDSAPGRGTRLSVEMPCVS